VYVEIVKSETRRGTLCTGTDTAFALVCAPGPTFHRLKPKLVASSVYLAMLCGRNATAIYMKILQEAYEHRVLVTLDSLKHSITYYLKLEFGTAVAIDTAAAFDESKDLQRYYSKANAKPDSAVVLGFRERIEREISRGELFVPIPECSARGWTARREGYEQAHIVAYPLRNDERITFGGICIRDAHAERYMGDAYPETERLQRPRRKKPDLIRSKNGSRRVVGVRVRTGPRVSRDRRHGA
jgi:hypothetical protein